MAETVLVKNSSSQDQVHRAEERERETANESKRDILTVLSTVEGRRFYWNLMSDCGVFMVSYVKDSDQTVFHEGMRSIGNQMMVMVNEADPNLYAIMVQEAKQREDFMKPKKKKNRGNGNG